MLARFVTWIRSKLTGRSGPSSVPVVRGGSKGGSTRTAAPSATIGTSVTPDQLYRPVVPKPFGATLRCRYRTGGTFCGLSGDSIIGCTLPHCLEVVK